MRNYKNILSVLLLFAILGGMVHNVFVSHSKSMSVSFLQSEKTPHHHHNHDSSQNQENQFAHLHHNNHFDDNYYDLFICILDDIEFPENNCDLNCFVLWNQKDDQLIKHNLKLSYSHEISNIIYVDSKKTIQHNYIQNGDIYSSPLIEHSPLRGPPIFSC